MSDTLAPRPDARLYYMVPGMFESSSGSHPTGTRDFGFPSLEAPRVGDMIGIDRAHGRVSYVVVDIGRSSKWDDGIDFHRVVATDANRAGCWARDPGRWAQIDAMFPRPREQVQEFAR